MGDNADLTLAESVQTLTAGFADIDMAAMLRNALKPRYYPHVDLKAASARAGELTGIGPVLTFDQMVEQIEARPESKVLRRAEVWRWPFRDPIPLALRRYLELGP